MKQYFIRRWFLTALALVLLLGFLCSSSLEAFADNKAVRYSIVAAVLFLMSLPLEIKAVWRSLKRPWAPLLAVAINFGLLPIFAWGLSKGLSFDMANGMLVAAATPCTLASASVWTRRAGGNDSVSILVTIITNLSCFLITPLWLFTMTGKTPESISLAGMIGKLGLLVVLPMGAAQILRIYRPLAWWAANQKTSLGVMAQIGILSMIFIGAIQSGVRLFGSDGEESFILGDFLAMVAAVMLIHLTMLWVGWRLAKGLKMPREDCIAVGFSGSQKTLMVGLQVAMECHFSILPMVTYHVGQLFVDTIIADRFRRKADFEANRADSSIEGGQSEGEAGEGGPC